jgi:hypothetical protein
MALAHHGTGGSEFVLVALDVLAIDEVRDVEDNFACFGQSAADLFVKRQEEPMHLEADGAGTSLPLAGARGTFTQVSQIFPANPLGVYAVLDILDAAIVDTDLQVHLCFAAEFVDVGEKLALIGANGAAEGFVVIEDRAETERKNGGMLEAIGNHAGVIDTGLLAERFRGVVFADDDSQIACRVEKDLITANAKNRLERNGLTMTG